VDSQHTKAALEVPDHPNIKVFRHPEHVIDGEILEDSVLADLKKASVKGLDLLKLPEDGMKKLYGLDNDAILYWAHHEKLCLVDGRLAFMGGLDLCFGRWDTNAHPIADVHPIDVNAGLFPGQDYNNARIYDFNNVQNYQDNKLNRTISSRMGWSDLSLCIQGPLVEDLRAHFVQRWNFIYNEKYLTEKQYQPLSLTQSQVPDGYYKSDGTNVKNILGTADPNDPSSPATHGWFHLPHRAGTLYNPLQGVLTPRPSQPPASGISVQLVRSCTQWSNGVATEASLAPKLY
jgi:phospholipase D1/2